MGIVLRSEGILGENIYSEIAPEEDFFGVFQHNIVIFAMDIGDNRPIGVARLVAIAGKVYPLNSLAHFSSRFLRRVFW